MIIVEMKLIDAHSGEMRDMGTARICNDKSGTPTHGNYSIEISLSAKYCKPAHAGKMWKHGKIKSFPRSGNLGGWDLLLRGLRAALGSRNNCFSDAEAGPGPDSDLVDLVRDVRSAQRRYFKSRSSDDLATSKRLEAILDEALGADAKQPGDSLFNADTALEKQLMKSGGGYLG